MTLLWSRHVGSLRKITSDYSGLILGTKQNKKHRFQNYVEDWTSLEMIVFCVLFLFNVLCSDDGKEHGKQDWLRVANYT